MTQAFRYATQDRRPWGGSCDSGYRHIYEIREPSKEYGDTDHPTPIFGPPCQDAPSHSWAEDFLRKHTGELAIPSTPAERDSAEWREETTLSGEERHLVQQIIGLWSTLAGNTARKLPKPISAIVNPECRQCLTSIVERQRRDHHALRGIAMGLGIPLAPYGPFPLPLPGHIDASDDDPETALETLCDYFLIEEGVLRPALLPLTRNLAYRRRLPTVRAGFDKLARATWLRWCLGRRLIEQARRENPLLWDAALLQRLETRLRETTETLTGWYYHHLPRGLIGLNAPMLEAWLRHLLNRRITAFGRSALFPDTHNPLSEMEWLLADCPKHQESIR